MTSMARDISRSLLIVGLLNYLASLLFLKGMVCCNIRRSLNEVQYPFDYGDNKYLELIGLPGFR